MATPFARVDLSPNARDFRPIAIEPGVPLLDQSGANDRIVFRWLGGMAAEPQWRGESAAFFVRDDQGGRLTNVVVQPAGISDLRGPLAEQLDQLRERLEKAQPETSTEVTLHRFLLEAFQAQAGDESRDDLDAFFFKWRSAEGGDAPWRLAWAWGYRRVDQEPVPAALCNDAECKLLFMRRAGQPNCPACQKLVPSGPKKPRRRGRQLAIPLLLLLILAALVWWWTHPPRLVVQPYEVAGPVGSRTELRILKMGLLPLLSEDVTGLAEGYSVDPTIARFDPSMAAVTLQDEGSTVLRFHFGSIRSAEVPVRAGPAIEPDELVIVPGEVKLAVGSTAQLKLIGRMEDGAEYDLSPLAEWYPQPPSDEVLFSWNGLLEGIGAGESTVTAGYRSTPNAPTRTAKADVKVAPVEFAALEVNLGPGPLGLNRPSRLEVDGVSADGERFRLTQSSRLRTEVSPPYLARVAGPTLSGRAVGKGRLSVKMGLDGKLSASTPIEVAPAAGVSELTVAPEQLEMIVGQVADLSIVSPNQAPIELISADVDVVEVSQDRRLVAREPGETRVTVAQGGVTRTVPVYVTRGETLALDMRPRLVVVPVDHQVEPRVLARVRTRRAAAATAPASDGQEGAADDDQASGAPEPAGPIERQVELAPDVVRSLAEPSPRFATFNRAAMEMRGLWPNRPSEDQQLALGSSGKQAQAGVHVIVAPMLLELKPRGPVELPLGQMLRLDGWAHYSGGRDVLVSPFRLAFDAQTNDETQPGLELRGNRVAALAAGGGPLSVVCNYFGNQSNSVDFTSVEADPDLELRLSTDRTLRLVGETGYGQLIGHGPKGDVELVPEMSKFGSTADEVLRVDERSGGFRAATPGVADMTAEHPAAVDPTSLPMEVFAPENAQLVFDPPQMAIGVDEVARLRLLLQVQDGEEVKQAELLGPGVAYTIGEPGAVEWEPPRITGRRPASPFELTGGFYPWLERPAVAEIEVVDSGPAPDLRINPAAMTLVPGQVQPLRVERLVQAGAASQEGDGEGPARASSVPGATTWKEVRPESVEWSIPPGVIFTPGAGGLPPTVELAEGAAGRHELVAMLGDAQAAAFIQTGDAPPAVDQLTLRRDPPGQFLAEGTAQRYSILAGPDDSAEPAANVRWPEAFENDYVIWTPPVLFAKRPGYEQWLRADVDGRTLLFSTTTYRPATVPQPEETAPAGDRPVALRILSDQGPGVQFPVGARFDDFRVEAEYADGFISNVTDEARLRTPEPPAEAPVSSDGRMLVGLRPGQTTVQADYMGLSTQRGLQATVTAEANPDAVRVRPSPATITLGETIPLEVEGLIGGKSIGLLTGLGGSTWQSGNAEVAETRGPTLTGNSLGKTEITADFRGVRSKEAPVSVVRSIGDALVIDPKVIRLRVGQSVAVGPDVRAIRGDLDLSRQCRVTPALSGVVRYDSATHSLVGVAPGTSAVAFTHGEKMANVIVEVFYGGKLEGDIVVQPSAGVLAVGQALPLRVFVQTPEGQMIDRTTSAVFRSSDESTATVRGNRACALAPGAANLAVILPELEGKRGEANIQVTDEPITGLVVEPRRLDLGTGDRASLRILGQAASGTHELFAQPSLTLRAGGQNPSSINVLGPDRIDAVSPGQAAVQIDWQNRLRAEVPVGVSDYQWSDLALEPGRAAVHPGEGLVYQLSGLRGGQRRVLTPADGVELFTTEPGVAQALGGMAVQGRQTGSTTVVARVGGRQVSAQLDVVPGSGATIGDVVMDDGVRVVTGPGYGTIVGDDWVDRVYVDDDGRRIVRRGGRDVIIEDGLDIVGDYVPLADVVGLQFVPDVVRLPLGSPGVPVRVYERLADGSLGRDVSKNPNLEITSPEPYASVEGGAEGLIFAPKQPGAKRLSANLGPMEADPMLLTVGDVQLGDARLVVAPDPLILWTGEEGFFPEVQLQPGDGQWAFPVDYRVTPEPGQGIVEALDSTTLRGTAEGQARVTVTAVAPGQEYDGMSATASVVVRRSDPIVIEPSQILLSVGQSTPVVKVFAQADDGEMYQVPAALESMDPDVLVPDPLQPGQFTAQGLGGTQLRATYRGREALATVRVGGDRFRQVQTGLDAGDDSFAITIEVLAADTEGPLEYRVYAAGQQPSENWVAASPTGDGRRAALRSPPLPYGPRGKMYHLTLEAKNPEDGSIQRYPLSFRLRSEIERVGGP